MYGAQTPFFWVLANSGDRCLLSAYRLVQEDLVRIARAVSEMSPLLQYCHIGFQKRDWGNSCSPGLILL